MFKTPCREVLENLTFWLNPRNFGSNGWKRKMSTFGLPLDITEVRHNNWQVWLFPSQFSVFMCCPASPAGQMELRKTRVTVLFVFVKVLSVSSLFPTACCFYLCNSHLPSHRDGYSPSHPSAWFGVTYRFANVLCGADFQNLWLYRVNQCPW